MFAYKIIPVGLYFIYSDIKEIEGRLGQSNQEGAILKYLRPWEKKKSEIEPI